MVAAHGGERLGEPLPWHSGDHPLVDQCHEQMLDRDVVVPPPLCLLGRLLQHPFEAPRDVHPLGSRSRARDPWTPAEVGLHLAAQQSRIDVRPLEQPWRQAVGLVEQGHRQMLRVDVAVSPLDRVGLRGLERLLRLLGQLVQVHDRSPGGRERWRIADSSAAMRSSRSQTSPTEA
ncbi:hypothetical protein GCM10027176_68270 [Actinoallomurus bryophytorum]